MIAASAASASASATIAVAVNNPHDTPFSRHPFAMPLIARLLDTNELHCLAQCARSFSSRLSYHSYYHQCVLRSLRKLAGGVLIKQQEHFYNLFVRDFGGKVQPIYHRLSFRRGFFSRLLLRNAHRR